jgi:hypothetical protein
MNQPGEKEKDSELEKKIAEIRKKKRKPRRRV